MSLKNASAFVFGGCVQSQSADMSNGLLVSVRYCTWLAHLTCQGASNESCWFENPVHNWKPGLAAQESDVFGHYLRLAPSFPSTFSGLSTPVPAQLSGELLVLSNWQSSVIQKHQPSALVHHNWIGAPSECQRSSQACCTGSITPKRVCQGVRLQLHPTSSYKVNARACLHSSACNQKRHLSKSPPISVQPRQVHWATSVFLVHMQLGALYVAGL